MPSRRKLTFEARIRRDGEFDARFAYRALHSPSVELFADYHCPTQEEKDEAYRDIVAMEGCRWYSKRVHSNYCSAKIRRLAQSM